MIVNTRTELSNVSRAFRGLWCFRVQVGVWCNTAPRNHWACTSKWTSATCLLLVREQRHLCSVLYILDVCKTVCVKSISILKGAENDREASEITCAWAMVDLPNTQEGVDEMVSMSSSEYPLLVGSMEHPVDVNSAHIRSGMISWDSLEQICVCFDLHMIKSRIYSRSLFVVWIFRAISRPSEERWWTKCHSLALV